MASIEWRGEIDVLRRLKSLEENMKSQIKSGSEVLANLTKDKAVEYCPEDTGKLVDSIHVESNEIKQGRNTLGQFTSEAVATFSVVAGGPDIPYALAVHEYPSEHNPPSWEGVDVHFRKGGPKFLERAGKETSDLALGVIGKAVEESIRKIR